MGTFLCLACRGLLRWYPAWLLGLLALGLGLAAA